MRQRLKPNKRAKLTIVPSCAKKNMGNRMDCKKRESACEFFFKNSNCAGTIIKELKMMNYRQNDMVEGADIIGVLAAYWTLSPGRTSYPVLDFGLDK